MSSAGEYRRPRHWEQQTNRRSRDRYYGDLPAERTNGSRILFAVLLAATVFSLLFAISCAQITAPGNARNLIAAGIATTTEADLLLSEELPAIRRLAERSDASAFTIPGYPLRIQLTREELLTLDEDRLRDLVIERSAQTVYAEGIAAFDQTGSQGFSLLSPPWLLQSVIAQVDEAAHARARLFALVLAGVAILIAGLLLVRGEGFGRFKVLGIAVMAGALPGLLGFGLIGLGAEVTGGADTFLNDIRTVLGAAIAVPFRNYLVVTLFGLAITVTGPVLSRLERREQADQEDTYDPGYYYADDPEADWDEDSAVIGSDPYPAEDDDEPMIGR